MSADNLDSSAERKAHVTGKNWQTEHATGRASLKKPNRSSDVHNLVPFAEDTHQFDFILLPITLWPDKCDQILALRPFINNRCMVFHRVPPDPLPSTSWPFCLTSPIPNLDHPNSNPLDLIILTPCLGDLPGPMVWLPTLTTRSGPPSDNPNPFYMALYCANLNPSHLHPKPYSILTLPIWPPPCLTLTKSN